MKLRHLLIGGGLLAFISGCGDTSTPSAPSSVPLRGEIGSRPGGLDHALGAGANAATPLQRPETGQVKGSVCHFDDEAGTWKRLGLAAPAIDAHLAHHDDAVPGGVTTVTGTALDADCAPATVGLACPCFDANVLTDIFAPGGTARLLTYGSRTLESWIHDISATSGDYGGPWFATTVYEDFPFGLGTYCTLSHMSTGQRLSFVSEGYTREQHEACTTELARAWETLKP